MIRRLGPLVGDPHLFRVADSLFFNLLTWWVLFFFLEGFFNIIFLSLRSLSLLNLLYQAIRFCCPLFRSIPDVISTSRVYVAGFDIFAMSSSPAGLDFDSNEKSHYVNPADLQSDPEKFVEVPKVRQDAFGDEEFAEVKYKVLKWWYVCIARNVQ